MAQAGVNPAPVLQALATAPLTTGATQTVSATNAQLATGNVPLMLLPPSSNTPGAVGVFNQRVFSTAPSTFTLNPFELAVTSAIQAGSGKSSAENVLSPTRLDLFSVFKDPTVHAFTWVL